MADTFSKEKRSQIMRQVKSRNNKSTELKLIKYFRVKGITGWRRNSKLEGKPDFIFPEKKIAIFVDGCFWHGHNCRNVRPSQNKTYWENKIKRNQKRDREVTRLLTIKEWKVIRLWECQLKQEYLMNKKIKFPLTR
jgi:DNA mismatch endonuclease (patch repair protein)